MRNFTMMTKTEQHVRWLVREALTDPGSDGAWGFDTSMLEQIDSFGEFNIPRIKLHTTG